tara:strand:- start:1159 stop:1467 length:309 start_codon:yes stop_codon:yes gene_type:complete
MTLKRISLIAGTIIAVFGAAGLVGFNIDRPVWLSEHTALAGEVKDNTTYRHEMIVYQIQERIWRVEDRMRKVGQKPDLVDQRRRLKATLIKAERRLEQMRGK